LNYIEEKQLTQTNNLQEENEKLNQTINELNQKIQQQTTECDVIIHTNHLFSIFSLHRILKKNNKK